MLMTFFWSIVKVIYFNLRKNYFQVSSPVCPINRGSRDNKGKRDSDHVKDAVYVAAVGARYTPVGHVTFSNRI